jgi:cytochrome c biogenesis protein CcmG, thiol:disulfide interchange protein DsbE
VTDHPASGPSRDRAGSHPVRALAIIVVLVVAGLIAVLATRDGGSSARIGRLVGRTAPNFTGTSMLDGSSFELAAQTGRYTVVNVFATWCPPCVKEHPELVRLSEDNPDITLVSLVFNTPQADIERFFRERGGSWPVISNQRALVDFGVTGVPETYIVDPDGRLIFQTNGGVTQKAILRAIDSHRSQQSPAAT